MAPSAMYTAVSFRVQSHVHTLRKPCKINGESGIRTHAPKKDDRISSAARYDHFDISPYSIEFRILCQTGLAEILRYCTILFHEFK